MTYIISGQGQTGDGGKTEILKCIAVHAMRKWKAKVQMIDLDAQEHRDTSKWINARKEVDQGFTPDLKEANSAEEGIELIDESYNLNIIDCPSRADEAGVMIANEVDLVVVPVGRKKSHENNVAYIAKLIGHGVDPEKIVWVPSRLTKGSTKQLRENRQAYELSKIDGNALPDMGVKYCQFPIYQKDTYGDAIEEYQSFIECSHAASRVEAEKMTAQILNYLQ